MELNRNPENYFAEVEQSAFNPANIVPGIGFSPGQDAAGAPVLLWRRPALPAGRQPSPHPGQRARCPVHSYHRDGAMRVDGNSRRHARLRAQQLRRVAGAARLRASRRCASTAPPTTGTTARTTTTTTRSPARCSALMSPAQQKVLFENTARAMGDAPEGGQDPPHRQLHEGRPGLRRGRGQGAGHPAGAKCADGNPAGADAGKRWATLIKGSAAAPQRARADSIATASSHRLL